MSRVGKRPITVPGGVKTAINGNAIKIEGPKGKLEYVFDKEFKVELKENAVHVLRPSEERRHIERHGLIRSLIQNMIKGVTEGYKKELEIRGVGYKAQVAGKKLTIQLGYSHLVVFDIPDEITIQSPKPTQIIITGIDKSKVGEIASEIRESCLPEPYKGKGIRYVGEYVRHKAGKKVA